MNFLNTALKAVYHWLVELEERRYTSHLEIMLKLLPEPFPSQEINFRYYTDGNIEVIYYKGGKWNAGFKGNMKEVMKYYGLPESNTDLDVLVNTIRNKYLIN